LILKKFLQEKNMVYIFHRKDGWYPIYLKDDKDAATNAENNSGTTKVTDEKGRVVWMRQ